MKVFEIMASNVISIKKESTILEAMKIMREKDIGFLIIEESREAIGVITDRDIVLALSREISSNTNITKIMKKYVVTIDENSDIAEASDTMGYMQIRRLVVVNKDKEIVGVISISDLLSCPLTEEMALETMIEISYNYPTKKEQIDNLLQTNAFIF